MHVVEIVRVCEGLALQRAFLHACAAGGASGIVDLRDVVVHGDRFGRTGFDAFCAADAARAAFLPGQRALVMVSAEHRGGDLGLRHQVDDPLRTDGNAFFAENVLTFSSGFGVSSIGFSASIFTVFLLFFCLSR